MNLYFVDTNIWLYGFIQNQKPEDAAKHPVSRSLLQSLPKEKLFISTQVINEVCKNLIKKASFSEQQIQALIGNFYSDYQVIELNRDILMRSSDLRQKYAISFWDGLIVASALYRNATILYSEDMQSGLIVEGQVKIVNPFTNPHS
jgi:predicted nucleic acid-binding protein